MKAAVILVATLLAAPAFAADEGQALFRTRCGICHLKNGFGANILARRVGPEKSLIEDRTDLTVAYVRLSVRQGIGSMPRFSKVELTDDELAAIAAYLTRSR